MKEFFKAMIPDLSAELQKRYMRADAQRHPEISDLTLLRAMTMANFISIRAGKINDSNEWELVHGDLKLKNILKQKDGTLAVIDPSPAFGGSLYDIALWAIDVPDKIEERCQEVSDYLGKHLQDLGSLAIALAIPEICLASPARAEATLEQIRKITGTGDLEELFGYNYLQRTFMERIYRVIRVP